MWPFWRRKRPEEKPCDKVVKRIVTGLIIGGAIGSVIGGKILKKHDEAEKEENGAEEKGS